MDYSSAVRDWSWDEDRTDELSILSAFYHVSQHDPLNNSQKHEFGGVINRALSYNFNKKSYDKVAILSKSRMIKLQYCQKVVQ